MTVLKTLSDEMLGFFILVSGIVMKMSFPDVADFWLALVTAITLFLIMHIRSHSGFAADTEENPLH
jgi:hypothetical protein